MDKHKGLFATWWQSIALHCKGFISDCHALLKQDIGELVLSLKLVLFELKTAIHNPIMSKTIPDSIFSDTFLDAIVFDVLAKKVPIDLSAQEKAEIVQKVRNDFDKLEPIDKSGNVKYMPKVPMNKSYELFVIFPLKPYSKKKWYVCRSLLDDSLKILEEENKKSKDDDQWKYYRFGIDPDDIQRVLFGDKARFIEVLSGDTTPTVPRPYRTVKYPIPSCAFSFVTKSEGSAKFNVFPDSALHFPINIEVYPKSTMKEKLIFWCLVFSLIFTAISAVLQLLKTPME